MMIPLEGTKGAFPSLIFLPTAVSQRMDSVAVYCARVVVVDVEDVVDVVDVEEGRVVVVAVVDDEASRVLVAVAAGAVVVATLAVEAFAVVVVAVVVATACAEVAKEGSSGISNVHASWYSAVLLSSAIVAGTGAGPEPGAIKNAALSTAIIPTEIAAIFTDFMASKVRILPHPNPSEE